MDAETHFRDRIGEDTGPSDCALCHAVSCFSCVQGYCTALEKVTVGGCVFYKDESVALSPQRHAAETDYEDSQHEACRPLQVLWH